MAATKRHWLIKQEPDTFSWDDFVKAGEAQWDGVRNYQARNNLRAMRNGDLAFYYHSGTGREIVGVAEVLREAYPDPTATGGDWSCVDFKPVKALKRPVSLTEIKADKRLENLLLVRHSRLSVMPMEAAEFEMILKLAASRL